MKFKYYMRGFGAGLIAATIILMIAGKVDDNNKSLSADKKQTDSTGSVIAFTTESSTEDKSQSETEEQTETQKQENTSTKEIIISETKATHVAEENTTQRPTVRITTGDGSGETELIFSGVYTDSLLHVFLRTCFIWRKTNFLNQDCLICLFLSNIPEFKSF